MRQNNGSGLPLIFQSMSSVCKYIFIWCVASPWHNQEVIMCPNWHIYKEYSIYRNLYSDTAKYSIHPLPCHFQHRYGVEKVLRWAGFSFEQTGRIRPAIRPPIRPTIKPAIYELADADFREFTTSAKCVGCDPHLGWCLCVLDVHIHFGRHCESKCEIEVIKSRLDYICFLVGFCTDDFKSRENSTKYCGIQCRKSWMNV